MPQATYTDPNKPQAQYEEMQQKRAAQERLARSKPAVSEFEQAQQRAANTRATTAPAAAPASVTAGVGVPVQASTLTPAEAASFEAQTKGGFSQKFPSAPTLANAQRLTNVGDVPLPRPPPIGAAAAAGVVPPTQAAPAGASIVDDVAVNASRLGRVGGAVKAIAGRAAVPLTVANGVYQTARVAADPTKTGYDIATKGLEETGKGAAAIAGGSLGAAAGSVLGPVGTVVGGIAGGAAGYFGGQALIDKGRNLLSGGAAQPAKPDFSNVTGGSQTKQNIPGKEALVQQQQKQQRQQDNDGITPPADRTGDGKEVLGTFNGKPITRERSDALAGNQSFGGSTTPSVTDGVDNYKAPRGGSPYSNNAGGGAKDRLRDISDTNSAAGKLYAALAGDKTPTGKRVAAQFLSDYIGAGTQERGQDVDISKSNTDAASGIQRGRESDASSIQQQNISARASRAERPQYEIGDDGEIVRISEGVAAPVLGKDGKPARVSKTKQASKDESDPIAAGLDAYYKATDPNGEVDNETRTAEYQRRRAERLKQIEDQNAEDKKPDR